MKDKYDKIHLDEIKPTKLYNDIDKEMSNLENHLDLLEAVVGSGELIRKIIQVLDSIDELHQTFTDLEEYIPAKNVFVESPEDV